LGHGFWVKGVVTMRSEAVESRDSPQGLSAVAQG
jgi:hypothetical protein